MFSTRPMRERAVLMRQGGHDLLGAGHLRHALGIDEGDHLLAPDAGGFQPADQVELLVDVEHGLLVLQAVAGADFDDLDLAGHQGASLVSDVRAPR